MFNQLIQPKTLAKVFLINIYIVQANLTNVPISNDKDAPTLGDSKVTANYDLGGKEIHDGKKSKLTK